MMKNKKTFCIGVGGAGINIANACWDTLRKEHGITEKGEKIRKLEGEQVEQFFSLTKNEEYIANGVFSDLENDHEILKKNALYDPNNIVLDKVGGGGLYVDAYQNAKIGEKVLDKTIDQIRKLSEKADSINAFQFFSGLSGGAGSGLLHAISRMQRHKSTQMQPKKVTSLFAVFPTNSSIVEAYNTILGISLTFEHFNLVSFMQNFSLSRVCETYQGIFKPSILDCNGLIADLFASLTSPMRFVNCDQSAGMGSYPYFTFQEFISSIVSYPRAHFVFPAMIPPIPKKKENYCLLTIYDLVKNIFKYSSYFIEPDITAFPVASISLLLRGEIDRTVLEDAICEAEKYKYFQRSEFAPRTSQIRLNNRIFDEDGKLSPISAHRKSATLFNSSHGLGNFLQPTLDVVNKAIVRRAFHWRFVRESFSEEILHEAQEDIAALSKDMELCTCTTHPEDMECLEEVQ